MAGIRRHLEGVVERVQWELPGTSEGDANKESEQCDKQSQLVITCSQARLPVEELGYIQWNCWPTESHGNRPQTTQVGTKTKGCSDRRVLSLMTKSTQCIEHGETGMEPAWILNLYVLVFLKWEGALQATKGETSNNPQNLSYEISFSCKIHCSNITELVGIANQWGI